MTEIYLAHSTAGDVPLAYKTLGEKKIEINLLCSFPYRTEFAEKTQRFGVRVARTILDSGAFSAWKSGMVIDIDALTAETKNPAWDESVCLDVIGDSKASMENALAMKAQGSPAYPVFHFKEPWEMLDEYCKQFDKVGLSCRFGETQEQATRWINQCFARQWPKRFHSFGWVKPSILRAVPFESADTASWRNAARYGQWRSFGNQNFNLRGLYDAFPEIEQFLKLQDELRAIWSKELSILGSKSAARQTSLT